MNGPQYTKTELTFIVVTTEQKTGLKYGTQDC